MASPEVGRSVSAIPSRSHCCRRRGHGPFRGRKARLMMMSGSGASTCAAACGPASWFENRKIEARLAMRHVGRYTPPLLFCCACCWDGIESYQPGRRAVRHDGCQLVQDHFDLLRTIRRQHVWRGFRPNSPSRICRQYLTRVRLSSSPSIVSHVIENQDLQNDSRIDHSLSELRLRVR